MIRTTFSALALSGTAMAFAPAALADPACPPDILQPADGAVVSPTPTIQATAHERDYCDSNVKTIKLDVVHVGSGNTVHSHEEVRGQGLTSGRVWQSGMLLVDYQLPRGILQSGESYRVTIDYSVPTPWHGPDGYSTTTEETVTFTVQGDTGGQGDHTIVISGSGAGTDYTIFGGGRLEQVDGQLAGRNVTIQGNDQVDGDVARGAVGSGSDGFRVFGDLPSIVLDQPDGAVIEVDGQTFAQIVITSENISGETGYTISGGGRLEQVEGRLMGYDVTIQGNDQVQGNRATGIVGGGLDGFRVYGAMPQITLDDPDAAVVFVNGEPD